MVTLWATLLATSETATTTMRSDDRRTYIYTRKGAGVRSIADRLSAELSVGVNVTRPPPLAVVNVWSVEVAVENLVNALAERPSINKIYLLADTSN